MRALSHFTPSQIFLATGANETNNPIVAHTSHGGELRAPIHITPKSAIQGLATNEKAARRTAVPTPAQVCCQLRTKSNSHRMDTGARLLTAVPQLPPSRESSATPGQHQRQRARARCHATC